jgi:hypothetical protein
LRLITRPAARAVLSALLLVLARSSAGAADLPLAGVATIRANSPRAMALNSFIENNLSSIIESTGAFKTVSPSMLDEELKKFGCTEEPCLLGFAREAGLTLFIRGDIDDSNDFIIISLRAYGINVPYQNRVVYQYSVRIPMAGRYGQGEYNSITEEHAGIFMSRLLARYRTPLYLAAGADNTLKTTRPVSGSFPLYRLDPPGEKGAFRGFRSIGTARLSGGAVTGAAGAPAAGDFILAGFEQTAAELDRYYYERKRDTVFKKPEWPDTIYAFLLTGPASAAMPIIAPFLGYYRSSDWRGLPLWAFNSVPYLYLEINGLATYWGSYYKKKRTVPRDVQAQYYFGLYMLTAGGMSMFVDAFAHSSIVKASNYQGVQPFMGNAITAGYLGLVAGGAGHFYRGYRLWGYLYYHADNLLLYFTIREFCPEKKYSPLTRSFTTARVNKTRAYALLSTACAVKIAEVIHAVLIRDNVRSFDSIEEGYSIEPVVYGGGDQSPHLGLQYSYRW